MLGLSGCLTVLFVTVGLTTKDTTAPKVPAGSQLDPAPENALSALPEGIQLKAGRLRPAHHKEDEYSRLFAALPELTWSPETVEKTFAAEDNAKLHRQLLALLLDAPEEHKPDLADHVANLTPDGDYAPIAWLISSRGVNGAAMQALLEDLHDRPARLKLPVMANILSRADHPGAPEAEHALNVYLQVNHGYPSDAWHAEVETFLATGQY